MANDLLEPPTEQVGRASARGAARTFVAQMAKLVVQFGTQIVLARLIEPAAFGLVAMAMPLIGFINIFADLGLSQAIIQRRDITRAQLNALFWVNVGFTVCLAAIVAALAPLAAAFYGEPRVAGIVIALSGLLIASGLSLQHMALLSRNLQFGALAAIDIAGPVMASAVGIGAALAGMGYWSLVLMQVANTATLTLLCWVFDDWRPSWPRWEAGTGGMLRVGGHLTGSNMASYLSNRVGRGADRQGPWGCGAGAVRPGREAGGAAVDADLPAGGPDRDPDAVAG